MKAILDTRGQSGSSQQLRFFSWVVAAISFIELYNVTAFNTALPAVAAAFGESPVGLKFVVVSYTLAMAICLSAGGWLAERWGAKAVLQAAICIFLVGSAICIFSHDTLTLSIGRSVQGVGAAFMTPVGRIGVLQVVDKSDLVRVMGFIAVFGLLGATLGPVVSGVATQLFGWRASFLVNFPLCLICLYLTRLSSPNLRSSLPGPFDVSGFLLLGVAVPSILTAAIYLGSDLVVSCSGAVLGVLLLIFYWKYSTVASAPIFRLNLFNVRTFLVATLCGSLSRLGISGIPILLSLLLQTGLGLSPIAAGCLLMLQAAAAIAMKFKAPNILEVFGYRNTLVANTFLLGLAIVAMSEIESDASLLFVGVIIFFYGLLASLQFTCLNTLAYVDLKKADVSMGSSIASMCMQASLSFGIATAVAAVGFVSQRNIHLQLVGAIQVVFEMLGGYVLLSSAMYATLRRVQADAEK